MSESTIAAGELEPTTAVETEVNNLLINPLTLEGETHMSTHPAETTINPLPDGVTEEPQSSDQLHLNDVTATAGEISTYLGVTDDHGQLLGDPELFEELKQLSESDLSADNDSDESADNLTSAVDTVKVFVHKHDLAFAATMGVFTYYGILLGLTLNKIKTRFQAIRRQSPVTEPAETNQIVKGTSWEPWILSVLGIGKSRYRNLQNFMQLAKASDALRYSFIGTERLLKLNRVANDLNENSTEPVSIGNIIRENGISFDLTENNVDNENNDFCLSPDQKAQIDFVSFQHRMTKVANDNNIRTYDELGLDRNTVIEAITTKAKPFTKSEMKEICIVKNSNGDTNSHLNKIVNCDNNREGLSEVNLHNQLSALNSAQNQFNLILTSLTNTNSTRTLTEAEIESMEEIRQKINQILDQVNPVATAA